MSASDVDDDKDDLHVSPYFVYCSHWKRGTGPLQGKNSLNRAIKTNGFVTSLFLL